MANDQSRRAQRTGEVVVVLAIFAIPLRVAGFIDNNTLALVLLPGIGVALVTGARAYNWSLGIRRRLSSIWSKCIAIRALQLAMVTLMIAVASLVVADMLWEDIDFFTGRSPIAKEQWYRDIDGRSQALTPLMLSVLTSTVVVLWYSRQREIRRNAILRKAIEDTMNDLHALQRGSDEGKSSTNRRRP